MSWMQHLKQRAEELESQTFALYLACKHPGTPWYAKAVAACVVAYALSPIGLIPDFIPVLGYLDDLILIPLGIALVIRLVPGPIMEECRRQLRHVNSNTKLLAKQRGINGDLRLCLRRETVDILHDHCHSLVLRKLFAGADQEVPVKDGDRARRWAAAFRWVVTTVGAVVTHPLDVLTTRCIGLGSNKAGHAL